MSQHPEEQHVLRAPGGSGPGWTPPDRDAVRLAGHARRIAADLRAADLPPSRPGGNHWVISYDVVEAAWFPAEPDSEAARRGLSRDGFSRGQCLLLFFDGRLAQGDWYGEVDPRGERVRIDAVTAPRLPEHAWSAANVARWRSGGRGGRYPHAHQHFRGFWPPPAKPLAPWEGTVRQLDQFVADGHRSQLPRHF